MFRHLLVPLDGSPLAEAAMPAARYLAQTLGAQVTLLHMIEENSPRSIHGQPHLANSADADEYLVSLAKHALPKERVDCHVHTSEIEDVASSIVAHARELQVDLIIMCTHGAGGVRHGLFGTVAQRVTALGTTPVLLVPVHRQPADPEFSCRRLLIPLDGNPDHEQALVSVQQLALGRQTSGLLLMVIPTWRDLDLSRQVASRTLPSTTVELLDATRDPAESYLVARAQTLQAAGCEASWQVVRGDPVRAIVAAAEDFQADLIVLGTHGTSHMEAFWSGRLTPQLAQGELAALVSPDRARRT